MQQTKKWGLLWYAKYLCWSAMLFFPLQLIFLLNEASLSIFIRRLFSEKEIISQNNAFSIIDSQRGLELQIVQPSLWERILFNESFSSSILPGLLPSIIIVVFAAYMLALIRKVESGEPFNSANSNYLRKMGFLMIGYGLFEVVISKLKWDYVQRIAGTDFAPAEMFGNTRYVFWAAIALLVLSQIFKQGKVLAEEQSLTV